MAASICSFCAIKNNDKVKISKSAYSKKLNVFTNKLFS